MPDQDLGGDAIRVHINRNQPLPDPSRYFHPPCFDADDNPVYFGSATLGNTIQPCKVTLKGDALICAVPHRLVERVYEGPVTVLPFTGAMELVPTSHGRIPEGCQPVVGGVDERGRALYHAVAWVRGERVPGRSSRHLGAAAVLLDGREHYVYDAHEILCWRGDEEFVVRNNNTDRAQNATIRPDQTRPGDKDLAGANLRVALSDLPRVNPYRAAMDLDDITPLYFGSAIFTGEVLPGKVMARTCQVLQNDTVLELDFGFTVLSLDTELELVPTSRGIIPHGRRPVEGNYDTQGRKLYHAMLYVVGRQFPGMCAEHLGEAQGVLQGKKYTSETGYSILCWKEHAISSSASSADPLEHFSFKDDLAGQRLRKPLNGKEVLTTAMAQSFGEHIPNELDRNLWFFASVLHEGSIIPSWANPAQPPSTFAYEGTTITTCTGLYCVLPYLRDRMMLIPATNGKIPAGMTPVEGGKDNHGRLLYHVAGRVSGNGQCGRMMGMAAEHLGGAVIMLEDLIFPHNEVRSVGKLANWTTVEWKDIPHDDQVYPAVVEFP